VKHEFYSLNPVRIFEGTSPGGRISGAGQMFYSSFEVSQLDVGQARYKRASSCLRV